MPENAWWLKDAPEGSVGRWAGEGALELFMPEEAAKFRTENQLAKINDSAQSFQNTIAGQQPRFTGRASRGLASGPYETPTADSSRAAQLALMQQMEAQRTGPSLAAMQGRAGLGQMTQQALMRGALGQGRVGMLGAQQAAPGMMSDVARARLAEDLKGQASIGAAAGGLRGRDLQSAEQELKSRQQAQALSDELARFYASQGATLDRAARDAALEDFKLRQRVLLTERNRAQQGQSNTLNTIGSIVGMGF